MTQPENSTATTIGFRATVKACYPIAGMFVWGLGFAGLYATILLERRWQDSLWRLPVLILSGIWLFWIPRVDTVESKTYFLEWLLCLPLGVLHLLRHNGWVPPVVGVLFVVYFWTTGKLRQRPIPVAEGACLISAVAVTWVEWPSTDRSLLMLVCVGPSASLQGAWFIVQHLNRTTPSALRDGSASNGGWHPG